MRLLCGLVLWAGLSGCWVALPVASGADPNPVLRKIEPPADWISPGQAERWIPATTTDWKRFLKSFDTSDDPSSPMAPAIMNAVYRATFDGQSLTSGDFDWTIHHFHNVAGFIPLGPSTLAVSQLKWPSGNAIHGLNPAGEWMLWSEVGADLLTGQWTHRGQTQLDAVAFELVLPKSLSSRLQIHVPRGWTAHIPGALGAESETPGRREFLTWDFDLGRIQTVKLQIERQPVAAVPRILLRESTIYGLTTTDDVIRLRTDLDCTVDGTREADLLLAAPKTLRVFNVLLGNELPLTFERELGSEEDRIRIPLRSLTPGQRVTLRILGESQRRTARSFSIPRLRPLNAALQSGNIRIAVDRPLVVRAVEMTGLRQTNLTEEAGQEIRTYEVLSNNCLLSLQAGEPPAVLQGEILFIADVRGDTPVSRTRVRLSTREGELFSPQMLIPSGWDLISVSLADSSDVAPAAWQVTPNSAGDSLLNLELRQPVRPDRDCTLLMELKASALKPGTTRRLPIPRIRETQHCYVRGVVWDQRPWELDTASTGQIELSGAAADPELISAVRWAAPEDNQAVPTGILIPVFDAQAKPLFREEGSTLIDPGSLAVGVEVAKAGTLLCANLELVTRTSRVGYFHPHRATFQLSHPASVSDFQLSLPPEAELMRVLADEREISFVRQDGNVILDPTTPPLTELVLEYRTAATPGWIVSRDEVVFPQLNCFITEFAWHLILDSERLLYRLPMTAAVSLREQPRPGERLLGPLARHSGETIFNPLASGDWKSLINGSPRDGTRLPSNEVWLIGPKIPPRVSMKTWKRDTSHSLAWCGFLGALASGIGLRRARSFWFRKGWIYLGGVWLVTAVFISEPYAPVAGGAFLGSVLAILIPRRFAIGRDWGSDDVQQRSQMLRASTVIAGSLAILGISLLSPWSHSQEATRPAELVYFEIPSETSETEGTDPAGPKSFVYFDSRYRPQWDNWRASQDGPPWLLKSSRYDIQSEQTGPPRITATYEVAVFGDPSRTALRLPLSGVSLDQVEGMIDGHPVRLIPAADRKGFVLPFESGMEPDSAVPPPPPMAESETATDSLPRPEPSRPVAMRTVVLKFRPLPEGLADEPLSYTATLPPLPDCVVFLPSHRWRIQLDQSVPVASPASAGLYELGPTRQLDLTSGPPAMPPRDNIVDVQMRTLVECGSLGGKVLIGVQPTLVDSQLPAELSLSLPAGLYLQSISGSSVTQSRQESLEAETRLTLQLTPTVEAATSIEIIAFLPATETGFRMAPPRWKPPRVNQQVPLYSGPATEARAEKAYIGVIAKPGFGMVDASSRTAVTPISPQSFSEALFAGLGWQTPEFAWNCRDNSGPAWTLHSLASTGRARLAQFITLQSPRSAWRLEAIVDTSQGVPFEQVFSIDPRIEIERVSVQQDGADRLLNWSRSSDEVWLGIRNSQPGMQTIRLEGTIGQGNGKWAPPTCAYRTGQTAESSVTIRNSSRVESTLKWADSTTRLRPNDGTFDEEVRYSPGTATTPISIQVDPTAIERPARIWVDLSPLPDNSWNMTLRAQLMDSLPLAAPVRIAWNQPGLSEFHLMNRRDNVRKTADGKAYLWRPPGGSSKPAELSLTASINNSGMDGLTLQLPQLSGVIWSEIWVSLPRAGGYRPARAASTLQTATPSNWPPAWVQGLTASRQDLYACPNREVSIEASVTEPQVRPVLAESLIWMEGAEGTPTAMQWGMTKFLLVAERDVTLEIPESSLKLIQAIALDGRTLPPESLLRIPSRIQDLSHEVVVWWQTETGPLKGHPPDLIRFPESTVFPHWTAVVPPHQQVLLNHWGRRDPLLPEFWLDRSDALLRATEEFRGASWSVAGPLLQNLSESRNELYRMSDLSEVNATQRDQLARRWDQFSRSEGSVSAPLRDEAGGLHVSGMDAMLSLCGESRALWLRSDETSTAEPQLLDRNWAILGTAGLAAIISLLILTWTVRLFRRLDIAEKLAARPNATMAGMGLIWWACLSPSVLGLGLAGLASGLWGWERMQGARKGKSVATKESAG